MYDCPPANQLQPKSRGWKWKWWRKGLAWRHGVKLFDWGIKLVCGQWSTYGQSYNGFDIPFNSVKKVNCLFIFRDSHFFTPTLLVYLLVWFNDFVVNIKSDNLWTKLEKLLHANLCWRSRNYWCWGWGWCWKIWGWIFSSSENSVEECWFFQNVFQHISVRLQHSLFWIHK